MGSYGIWMALSGIIGGLFGTLGTILFFKPRKKKEYADAQNSEAMAEGVELNNVEKAIAIWRGMAESLNKELETQRTKSDELARQIEKLTEQVKKLTCINNRIFHLLDKITPENFEEIKGEMKLLIEK